MQTTKERLVWALRRIHGESFENEECFVCIYHHEQRGFMEQQKPLGYALIMMGVPFGVYETFKLVDTEGGYVLSKTRQCGRKNGHDPDWQKFIDEVVSIVDGTGS